MVSKWVGYKVISKEAGHNQILKWAGLLYTTNKYFPSSLELNVDLT